MPVAVEGSLYLPGDQLPNHRTLVAARLIRRKRDGEAGDLWAVLALNDPNYAVWILVNSDEPYCIHGFYTGDFEAAVRDYNERSL